MKTWTVKAVVGPDHQITMKVPNDIPEGPLEMVVVAQPPKTIKDLGWTIKEAAETRNRLKSFEEDWDTPEMEVYDNL